MNASLLLSAFAMGLAGAPHCVAMCGTACGGAMRLGMPVRDGRAGCGSGDSGGAASGWSAMPAVMPVQMAARGSTSLPPAASTFASAPGSGAGAPLPWLFAGRTAGYAAAGALAAITVQGLGIASGQLTALRPLWLLLHVSVLAWGLLLLAVGRQPRWSLRTGRLLSARLRSFADGRGAWLAVGALWTLMPCGLLYSALMLASLAGGPGQGALAMSAFAIGSGLPLFAAPWALRLFGWQLDRWRQGLGTRIAGLMLAAVALQALGLDLGRQIGAWCA